MFYITFFNLGFCEVNQQEKLRKEKEQIGRKRKNIEENRRISNFPKHIFQEGEKRQKHSIALEAIRIF